MLHQRLLHPGGEAAQELGQLLRGQGCQVPGSGAASGTSPTQGLGVPGALDGAARGGGAELRPRSPGHGHGGGGDGGPSD